MHKYLVKVLFLTLLFFATSLAVFAQEQPICISQQAANQAAQNARVIPTLEEKIRVLEAALIEKDKNTQEIRDTAAKNEADLEDALRRTEIELAKKTGEVIQLEADRTRWNAVVDVLIKNSRKKSIGLIAF